ncbi:MAG: helix-turn-helix domain-containing protein [Polyangiaceae bacterium]
MGRHDWPGNVRELRNFVERTVVLKTASPTLKRSAESATDAASKHTVDIAIPFKIAKDAVIEDFERAYLAALLEASGGNMSKAARTAGMDRMYLHRLVQRHGLRGGGAGGGNAP